MGGLLSRQRLVDDINGAGRVVVLRAEGGAGKTTAVAQWSRERSQGNPLIWVSLNDAETRPVSFWASVLLATTTAVSAHTNDLLMEQLESTVTVDQMMSLFIATIMQQTTPVTLVVDDLHLVREEAQQQLLDVIRRVPSLSLITTTRTRSPFETPMASAALGVTVIDSKRLSFTPEEMAAVATSALETVDDSEFAVLTRITRGHTLATRLALASVRGLRASGATPTINEVIRAVDAATIDLLPHLANEEEQRFALTISLCPEVDARLATELHPGGRGWELVESLADQGLGRITTQAGRPVFLMHTLVQSALRREALTTFSESEILTIHRTALTALRDVADPVDVMALMLSSEADAQVFTLFAAHFSRLSLFRTSEITSLLSPLPQERFEQTPTLAVVLVVAMSEQERSATPRVLELVSTARPRLNAQFEREHGATATLIALARFALMRGVKQYGVAADRGREFLHAIDQLPTEEQTSLWNAGKVQVVITEILAGNFDKAADLAPLIESEPHAGRKRHMQSLQALVHALIEDAETSEQYLELVGHDPPPGWHGSLYSVGWHLAQALKAEREGDTQRGFEQLKPIEVILPRIELWVAVLYVYGRLLRQSASPNAAHTFQKLVNEQADRPLSPIWKAMLDDLQEELFNEHLEAPLTERERAVLAELSSNETLATIADRLYVSVNTLKTQTRSIYRKLQVTSRTQAVTRAAELGIITP